jgi:hypothetical protein
MRANCCALGCRCAALPCAPDSKASRNEEDMRIYELAYPATTNATKLAKSLTETKDDSAVTVIFSTYQSIEVVHQAQQKTGIEFDLVVCDFFFAWLSPVLRQRYPWMAREDSSDQGEVQHKDPRVFARQLALVFTEACRALKDDGVLAFSFHHSRAEGWAAIYEAINKAGLAVVAAHPVHAELRAASPKTAAKDPISLDAILVCRKKAFALHQSPAIQDVRQAVDTLALRLQAAGLRISAGDRFVIGAAQTLISRAADDLSFDEIKVDLESILLAVGPKAVDQLEAANAELAFI